MKRFLYTLTALALLATSCSTDSLDYGAQLEQSATISVEVLPSTRTYTDGSKIYWAPSGEQLNIIYYSTNDDGTTNTRRQSFTHEDYTLTDNRAQFTADLTTTDGAVSYTLGAFYPYEHKYTTSPISLTVPQEQTPAENSYDPATDILVSQNPITVENLGGKITFSFARLVAFAKMTLVGIGEGEKIETIVFSSPAKPNGAVEFKVHEQSTLENAKWYNNYEDITLNMNGRVATGEDTVWFTTVPTDLSGTSFTVTVTTDKFNYSKIVDLTDKTLNFKRADIAQFRVKELVKEEKPKAYKLLTDLSQLNAGDQIVFCTKNSASSSAKLLSTAADGSALKFTESTTVDSDLSIATPPAGTALFTVENGVRTGTLSFKAAEGYLYGTYDSENWESKLSFKDKKDRESSWEVTMTNSYAISCLAYYTDTDYRYLNNYYGSKFNFAGSISTYYYYIYYIDGENTEEPSQPTITPLATPVVSASATGNTVTVSWAAVDGAANYTVTCGTATQTVTASPAQFSDLEYATGYTVSVVANPTDAAVNSASEAGTAAVTTEAAPSQGGEPQSITLTFPDNFPEGATSGNTVGTIYEGDLVISSTGSWRTSRGDGRDAIYIGRTTDDELRIEAQNGKTITKVTLTAPNTYTVDLKWKEHDGYTSGTYSDSWTGECKSRLVFTAAGNEHTNIASIVVEYK